MNESVSQNSTVVGVGRPSHADVSPERVTPQSLREKFGPSRCVDESVVVNLVEVVAPVIVRLLDKGADHVRRRVLQAKKRVFEERARGK